MAGGTVLLRAATQAWKQAIVSECHPAVDTLKLLRQVSRVVSRDTTLALATADGQRQGMTPETLKKTASLSRQMPLEEAYLILGTDSKAGIEEVMKVSQLAGIEHLTSTHT